MTFKEWDGSDLVGRWQVTIKIDGIQGRKTPKGIVSKNGKPLYHLPNTRKNFEIAEIYIGGKAGDTWSIISASKSERRKIRESEIYPLFPRIDRRLNRGWLNNPIAEEINYHMKRAVKDGFEGLVLRQGSTFIKVKTVYTEDVKITGFTEGKGKFAGILGKIHTEKGEVGTGFTNQERMEIWGFRQHLLGTFVEVKSMEKTKNGLFRNPRFVRLRPDK